MSEEIELGDKVRDKVSGLEGIAVARTEYLNGCVVFYIQPRVAKGENKAPEEVGFDKQVLEVVEESSINVDEEDVGGPKRKLKRTKY